MASDGIDRRLTTWEGARREQLRRWAELPLERILLALEAIDALAAWLHELPDGKPVARDRHGR